jgi:hypothetical protein
LASLCHGAGFCCIVKKEAVAVMLCIVLFEDFLILSRVLKI